jgi:hypothetical protein
MSLLRRLDEAFAANPDPDAIAFRVSVPFSALRTFGSITKDEYETYRKININVYNQNGSYNSGPYKLETFGLHNGFWGSLKTYFFIASQYDTR